VICFILSWNDFFYALVLTRTLSCGSNSKAKTPIAKISKQMKRTIGALRQQALKPGIGLGHRR
jgi:ABC-type glycerol-3-phosphate transport system permease component